MGKEAHLVPLPVIVQNGLRLRELLPEAELLGSLDLLVGQRFVRDARQVRPGDVWVALPSGKNTPSRRVVIAPRSRKPKETPYISRKELAIALTKGAAAVVTDAPLYEDLPIPRILVPDVHEAWGRICHALAGYPSKTLKLIVVTGRLGTTATSWLLKEILTQAGYRTGLLSSVGSFDGATWHPSHQTDHTPEGLAKQLARMVRQQCTHAVVEVWAGDLANRRLAGIDLDVVCLTPFGWKAIGTPPVPPAIPSMDQLSGGNAAASRSLSESIPSAQLPWITTLQTGLFRYLKPEGLTLLSADDPVSAGCLPVLEGPVLTVSQRHLAEITAQLLEAQLAEQTFLLQAGADVVPVRTRRIGKEHINSCLLAAAVGLAYGMDLPQVVRALEAVETVPAQLERIERGQPFAVFLQLARSAAEVHSSLQALRWRWKGRLWCVAGLDPQKQKKAHLLGRLLARYVDRLVLTVEEPASASSVAQPPAYAKPILEAFGPPKEACWLADRGNAIFAALQQAHPGDCVLILTKLGKTYPAIGSEYSSWDDRAVVHACLEHLYPPT